MDEWKETFKPGTPVRVAAKAAVFGGLETYGLYGCTCKIDDKAGVCVAVAITKTYSPCFWFNWSWLSVVDQSEVVYPESDTIAMCLGGRSNALPENQLTRKCLQAWMLTRLRVPEGNLLEQIVLRLNYTMMLVLYSDTTDRQWNGWVSEYDNRVKRPRMSQYTTGELSPSQFNSVIGITRPKMGGR